MRCSIGWLFQSWTDLALGDPSGFESTCSKGVDLQRERVQGLMEEGLCRQTWSFLVIRLNVRFGEQQTSHVIFLQRETQMQKTSPKWKNSLNCLQENYNLGVYFFCSTNDPQTYSKSSTDTVQRRQSQSEQVHLLTWTGHYENNSSTAWARIPD